MSKQFKVAMLTGSLDQSLSAEGFIVDWVRALAAKVDQLVVVIPTSQRTIINQSNVTVYELNDHHKLGKLSHLYHYLYQEHQQAPFSSIFSHIYDFMAASGTITAKLLGVKSVMWFAGGISLPQFSTLHFAMKLSDEIVTVSQHTKNRYRSIYHLHQPIHVIGHAIDTGKFTPHTKPDSPWFTIGSVGRLALSKNLITLVNSFNAIKLPRKLKLHLVISNTHEHPKLLQELKKRAHQINRQPNRCLHLSTNIAHSQMPQIFQNFDLYVHPSKVLSVDKAGLEAITSGIPVLLSQAGYSGLIPSKFLFSPENPEKLTSLITHAVQHYSSFSREQKPFQKQLRSSFSLDSFTDRLIPFLR